MTVSFKEYTIREYTNGTKEWRFNGELHREDGPAYEQSGHKEWYLNGVLHREDGPAQEYIDGHNEWYLNGKQHREDGPAVEDVVGGKRWYLEGVLLDEDQHRTQTQSCAEKDYQIHNWPSCDGKVITIDGKQYKLSEV